jgi:hypothetical protein
MEDADAQADTWEQLILKMAEIGVQDSFLMSQISICTETWTECEIMVKSFSSERNELLCGLRYGIVIGSFLLTAPGTVKGSCRYYEISHCRYVVNLEANRNCSCTALSPPHQALPSSSLTRWGISRTVRLPTSHDLHSLSFSFWDYELYVPFYVPRLK